MKVLSTMKYQNQVFSITKNYINKRNVLQKGYTLSIDVFR